MLKFVVLCELCLLNISSIMCSSNSTDFRMLFLKIHPIKSYYYPKEPNFIQREYNSEKWMLNHNTLVIGYRFQRPFIYFDNLKNEFNGIEWKIIKMFAERKKLSIKTVECLDVASCEK